MRILKPVKSIISASLISDIEGADRDVYIQPLQKNYSSIDAIYTPDVFIQYTTSDRHPIKINRLLELDAVLRTSYELIFVVPPDVAETFKFQPYAGSSAVLKRPNKRQRQLLQNMSQWVLTLPYDFPVEDNTK